jgi:hypothetical protein
VRERLTKLERRFDRVEDLLGKIYHRMVSASGEDLKDDDNNGDEAD